VAAAVTVAAGLSTRGLPAGLPRDALGDALYTVLVYCLVLLAAPRARPVLAAAVAAGFSFAVEFAQLTGVPADAARHVPAARLVLGTGFSAADLLWYTAGTAFAAAIHHRLRARQSPEARRARSGTA
jgi:hypothetical protein